jgi:phosphoadenosine phosphosulfate reductase
VIDVQQNQDVTQLNAEFETAYPQDILRWAVETYGSKLALVTSFQPTGIVTLHMLDEIGADTSVYSLDTGLLFPETYRLIDEMTRRFAINLHRVKPELTVEQQAEHYGDRLWELDPNRCCNMRKTVPLKQALRGKDAWITGLRRDQSPRRANTPIIAYDERNDMIKLCPFATWTEEMIWTYIHAHELPYNALHDQGYPSIGCHTCTHAASSVDDSRSGRWVNHNKTECGIHFDLVGEKN